MLDERLIPRKLLQSGMEMGTNDSTLSPRLKTESVDQNL